MSEKENKIIGNSENYALDAKARQRLAENAKKIRAAATRQRGAENSAVPVASGKTLLERVPPDHRR